MPVDVVLNDGKETLVHVMMDTCGTTHSSFCQLKCWVDYQTRASIYESFVALSNAVHMSPDSLSRLPVENEPIDHHAESTVFYK